MINAHEFKNCLGCFASGVTVITCIDSNQAKQGITINSFSSLSLNPPLILFSLAHDSNNYPIFSSCKKFTVNILSDTQLDISNNFAFNKKDKWQNVSFSLGNNGCPVIDGVVAFIECDMHLQYQGGDHTIIIGKVTNLHKNSETKPLVYFQGKYNSI